MTSSNIVDASRSNGHENGHDKNAQTEKSPEQIQLEIARTRSAITEDLLALSEKLSPEHLREGAREVMRDAREEAKEVLRDAKDAAIGSLRDMKDRALESVSGKVTDIGQQAKHAGALTVSFVSAHAMALSLLGLGTGWLLMALRRRQLRLSEGEGDYGYHYEHYSYPTDEVEAEGTRGVRSMATRATHAVDEARERARSMSRRASELDHDTTGGALRGAGVRAREVASDHRMAVVALTVAAGLGLGLLLPVGRRPRRAMARAGERMWHEAETLGRQVGARARNFAERHTSAGPLDY